MPLPPELADEFQYLRKQFRSSVDNKKVELGYDCGQSLEFLKDILDHDVTGAESDAAHRRTAQGFQQVVVATATANGQGQSAFAERFEDGPCIIRQSPYDVDIKSATVTDSQVLQSFEQCFQLIEIRSEQIDRAQRFGCRFKFVETVDAKQSGQAIMR